MSAQEQQVIVSSASFVYTTRALAMSWVQMRIPQPGGMKQINGKETIKLLNSLSSLK